MAARPLSGPRSWSKKCKDEPAAQSSARLRFEGLAAARRAAQPAALARNPSKVAPSGRL